MVLYCTVLYYTIHTNAVSSKSSGGSVGGGGKKVRNFGKCVVWCHNRGKDDGWEGRVELS